MTTLVVDCGTSWTHLGFEGDINPTASFPTLTGRPKHNNRMIGLDDTSFFIGKEIQTQMSNLKLSNVVKNGVIQDFDEFESLLYYAFIKEMRIHIRDHPMLFSKKNFTPKRQIEKLKELLFENFKVPSLYFEDSCCLALNSVNCQNSIGVLSGGGITETFAQSNGIAIQTCKLDSEVSGEMITDEFLKKIQSRGYGLSSSSDRQLVNKIKENTTFISLDYNNEDFMCKESKVFLPDGQSFTVKNEKFESTEILFSPSSVGSEALGIHELIEKCAKNAPDDIKSKLYENIYVFGGNSMIPGFQKRVELEMNKMHPQKTINITGGNSDVLLTFHQVKHRDVSVWKGGSIFAQIFYPLVALSKFEYYEK